MSQGKPGTGLDTWDVVKAVGEVEADPDRHAYLLLRDGTHRLIGAIRTDQDGDLIFVEEGAEIE